MDETFIPFQQNIKALLDSIEDCLSRQRIIPCLILLYSGMDTISALEPGRASPSSFKEWVTKYVLKHGSALGCTASDIYASRCGVVHSLSAESDHSKAGKARRIVYAWGTANAESLARTIKIMKRSDCVVHVRELVDAFRSGLADYLEEITHDERRQKKLSNSASLWFTNINTDRIETFLAQYDSAQC